MELRCPECKTPLLPGTTSCVCGWKESGEGKKKVVPCGCGRPSRILFRGNHKCWPCYHDLTKGTELEDWRDKLVRETMFKGHK